MKKIISFALILTLLLSLTSCAMLNDILSGMGITNNNTIIPTPDPTPEEDHVDKEEMERYYRAADTINRLFKEGSQERVNVTIATEKNGITLVSYYEIDPALAEDQIRYSIQTIGTFREEGGVIVAPESFIVTSTGVGTLMQDRLVSFDGKIVSLPYVDFLKGVFYLDVDQTENFECYDESYICSIYCTVLDVQNLLGCSVNAEQGELKAEYTEDTLRILALHYETYDGMRVSLTYDFS